MKNIYLIEFITSSDDHTFIAFDTEPTDQEISEVISANDWLLDEFEEDGLDWVIEKITYIERKKK